MSGKTRALEDRISELEQRLEDAALEISYYKNIAENAGAARLRETEALSQLLRERMRIEAELEQHRDHLEELVEQRTGELSWAMAETQLLNTQLRQEVHERKRAEDAIRDSEEKFRVLAHNSPDVIMRFDSDFRHLYVNPVVQAQTGIPHKKFIGRTHFELDFPPSLIAIWEKAIQRVFDSQREHRIEFQLPNGTWIDWLLFPEFDSQCKVGAVLTTARDISEYKNIEETLRQEIVERKRAEETQRSLEAQLRQTQKMEALGRLAGGIAHDFNNILAIMLGNIEILRQDVPEASQEYIALNTVWRAGERAADLVRQILLFSRFQEHHLETTDLSQIVEDTLSLLRATIPISIDIFTHIQPNCRPIRADVSQIQQVVVNLCVNAKDAMQEDGGILEISLTESTLSDGEARGLGLDSGDYLKLTVSDTGQGMSTAVKEHIFEPFYSTKGVGEGSGLGLAVVHGIVSGHGGAITVESDTGCGTTFSVLFPLVPESVTSVAPTEDHCDTSNGQGHLLVVDDEVDLVDLYEFALAKSGFRVTTCTNGEDALSTFRANSDGIDLVFTDQMLPGMTGTQLSKEILKIREDVPIILATGYSDTITERNAADYGFTELFIKPVQFRTLIPAIKKILLR